MQNKSKKEITYVLATKVKNHDLGFVTVTEVALTGDYSQAKVFYTVLGGEKEKERTKESFKKIKGFVKSEVAKKIKIRKFSGTLFFSMILLLNMHYTLKV